MKKNKCTSGEEVGVTCVGSKGACVVSQQTYVNVLMRYVYDWLCVRTTWGARVILVYSLLVTKLLFEQKLWRRLYSSLYETTILIIRLFNERAILGRGKWVPKTRGRGGGSGGRRRLNREMRMRSVSHGSTNVMRIVSSYIDTIKGVRVFGDLFVPLNVVWASFMKMVK